MIIIAKKSKAIKILLIIIIVVIIVFLNIPKKIEKVIYKKQYSEYVQKYSKEYNIDENLIYAVIKAESNFNENARSEKGAIGLMQIMESTAKDIFKNMDLKIKSDELADKLSEPETNINVGTKYLSILLQKYKNIEVAITAYNAGIGTVDTWIEKGIINQDGSNIEKIPYKETNNYVRKILRDYKIYSKIS